MYRLQMQAKARAKSVLKVIAMSAAIPGETFLLRYKQDRTTNQSLGISICLR